MYPKTSHRGTQHMWPDCLGRKGSHPLVYHIPFVFESFFATLHVMLSFVLCCGYILKPCLPRYMHAAAGPHRPQNALRFSGPRVQQRHRRSEGRPAVLDPPPDPTHQRTPCGFPGPGSQKGSNDRKVAMQFWSHRWTPALENAMQFPNLKSRLGSSDAKVIWSVPT